MKTVFWGMLLRKWGQVKGSYQFNGRTIVNVQTPCMDCHASIEQEEGRSEQGNENCDLQYNKGTFPTGHLLKSKQRSVRSWQQTESSNGLYKLVTTTNDSLIREDGGDNFWEGGFLWQPVWLADNMIMYLMIKTANWKSTTVNVRKMINNPNLPVHTNMWMIVNDDVTIYVNADGGTAAIGKWIPQFEPCGKRTAASIMYMVADGKKKRQYRLESFTGRPTVIVKLKKNFGKERLRQYQNDLEASKFDYMHLRSQQGTGKMARAVWTWMPNDHGSWADRERERKKKPVCGMESAAIVVLIQWHCRGRREHEA